MITVLGVLLYLLTGFILAKWMSHLFDTSLDFLLIIFLWPFYSMLILALMVKTIEENPPKFFEKLGKIDKIIVNFFRTPIETHFKKKTL